MKTTIEEKRYTWKKDVEFTLVRESTKDEVFSFSTVMEAKIKQKELLRNTATDFNGKTFDIDEMQTSLRVLFQSFCQKDIDNAGVPFLHNCVQRDLKCGCAIVGNGSLSFPLTIQQCKKHK